MKKALLCGVSLLLCIGLITGCNNPDSKKKDEPIPATGISLSVGTTEYSSGSSYTLGVGEKNGRYIYANLEPADSTSEVTWVTSDTSLLNIEVFPNTHSIFLTALYNEASWSESETSKNATLTATTEEGYSASLNIVVNKPLGTSTTKTNTTVRVFFTKNSSHTIYYALPDYTGCEEEWPGCKEDCFTNTTGSLTYWWYDEETGDWPTITGKALTEGINEADNIVYYDTVIDELEVGIEYGALVALKFNSSITTEFNTNDYSFSVSQYDVADDGGVIELYITQNPANIIQPFAPVDMELHIYFEDESGKSYVVPTYAQAYLSGDYNGWSYSSSTELTVAGTDENPYYTITLTDMAVVEDMEFAVYLEYTGWSSPSWLKYYGNFTQTPTSGVVDVHLPGGDPADTIHDPSATAHVKIELVNTGTSLTSAGSYAIAGWAGVWGSTPTMSCDASDYNTYYYEGDIVAYNDFEFTIIYNSSTWQRVIFEPSAEDSGNYWFDSDNNTFITGAFFEQDHSYVFKLEADLASWNGTSNLTASSYSFTDVTEAS